MASADPLVEMLQLLVAVGATPASAAKAAVMLGCGASTQEAWDVVVVATVPVARYDVGLLLAQAAREYALVRRL